MRHEDPVSAGEYWPRAIAAQASVPAAADLGRDRVPVKQLRAGLLGREPTYTAPWTGWPGTGSSGHPGFGHYRW
jgi:hypothetical protein